MNKRQKKEKVKSEGNKHMIFIKNIYPKIKYNTKLLSKLKVFVNEVIRFIGLFASIATCVTVIEMRSERIQLYKPYFIIEDSEHLELMERIENNIDDTYSLAGILKNNVDCSMQIPIIINNIDSGTAIDIKIVFSCDKMKDYMKLICYYYDDKDIEYGKDYVKIYYDNLNSGTRSYEYYFFETEDIIIEIPYVFSKDYVEIMLPKKISELLYFLIYCNGDFDYDKVPAIDLEIYYDDLQGIEYRKKYKLDIDFNCDYTQKDMVKVKYILKQCK